MKNNFRFVILFIGFAIIVPVFLELFIFGNSVQSHIDNNGWASFFGSFLGAIIGGGCTCWAVIKQKEYSDVQKRLDEVAQIKPYIVAENPKFVKLGDNLSLIFDVHNVGLHSALDIELYAKNFEKAEPLILLGGDKYCLTVDSKVQVKPDYNFNETFYYEFHFVDLKSNLYVQEFRYSKESNSFISIEPKFIKNISWKNKEK